MVLVCVHWLATCVITAGFSQFFILPVVNVKRCCQGPYASTFFLEKKMMVNPGVVINDNNGENFRSFSSHHHSMMMYFKSYSFSRGGLCY